jgi:hypothetical protein
LDKALPVGVLSPNTYQRLSKALNYNLKTSKKLLGDVEALRLPEPIKLFILDKLQRHLRDSKDLRLPTGIHKELSEELDLPTSTVYAYIGQVTSLKEYALQRER